MSTNHRILGMHSNIAYGVCFIIPILAIIVLLIDRSLSKENKQFMWEAILGMAAAIILGFATFFIKGALGWIVFAVMVIFGIINIFGSETHLPFVDRFAAKIVG